MNNEADVRSAEVSLRTYFEKGTSAVFKIFEAIGNQNNIVLEPIRSDEFVVEFLVWYIKLLILTENYYMSLRRDPSGSTILNSAAISIIDELSETVSVLKLWLNEYFDLPRKEKLKALSQLTTNTKEALDNLYINIERYYDCSDLGSVSWQDKLSFLHAFSPIIAEILNAIIRILFAMQRCIGKKPPFPSLKSKLKSDGLFEVISNGEEPNSRLPNTICKFLENILDYLNFADVTVTFPLRESYRFKRNSIEILHNFGIEAHSGYTKMPIAQIFHGGYAYILNHEFYVKPRRTREGSAKDVQKLCEAFRNFYMEYKVIESPSLEQVNLVVDEIRKKNFNSYSSLVLVILAHGRHNETIETSDDKIYSISNIERDIIRNPSLSNKPKILIVQACKGTNRAQGRDENNVREYGIPTDMIKFNSTSEGYTSQRIAEEGTVFIDKITECFRESGSACFGDLPALLGKKVITETESWRNSAQHGYAKVIQVPSTTSTMAD